MEAASAASSQNTITISVVGNQSIYKTEEKSNVNVEEVLHYKIVFANSTETASNINIIDVLPYNGDARGTKYQGAYVLKGLEIEGGTDLTLYTTTDENIRTKEDAGKILIVDDKNLATFLSVFLYKIKIKIGFGSLHIRHQPQ